MRFCSKCGNELSDTTKFCGNCGAVVAETIVPTKQGENNYYQNISRSPIKTVNNKRKLLVCLITVLVLAVVGTVIGTVISKNVEKNALLKKQEAVLEEYEENLEEVYELMCQSGEEAESYATLEEKVWRNCIYEDESSETDKYTMNAYGYFFDDFNDALTKFYIGESDLYDSVESSSKEIEALMKDLKDCPDEFEDTYKAIKEMYVAYNELADLVIGDSSYSLNSFSERLDDLKSDFKSARAEVKVLVE